MLWLLRDPFFNQSSAQKLNHLDVKHNTCFPNNQKFYKVKACEYLQSQDLSELQMNLVRTEPGRLICTLTRKTLLDVLSLLNLIMPLCQ